MFAKSVLTVALVTLSAPVLAQSINPGTAQFAAQLGVDPTQYSLQQLIQLDTARRDGMTETYNYILQNPDNLVTRSASYNNPVPAGIYNQE